MKKIISMCMLLAATACLFAKNISIQIVQNNPAAQNDVCASSTVIEQAIIDYFFGSGHIVSNSPVFIVSKDSADNGLTAALQENAEGGMDYLVRIEVDYNAPKNTRNPDAVLLENIKKITWKNYAVATGVELSEGSEELKNINRLENNEDGVVNFANLVAIKINADLNRK